jgi:uncharacterized protein (TIGR03437 family)
MSALRVLAVVVLSLAPLAAGTFGTVVPHPQPIADLAYDEGRKRLYVVNTAANAVEVYNAAVNPPIMLRPSIGTGSTPLSIALSRSGRYLYVACYGASSLDIIDLSTTGFSSRTVTLPASPEAVAVGFDERVLISTIGTGTGQSILLTYDPALDAAHALGSIAIGPPAPSAPVLPPPNGVMALAARAKLQASRDGRTIVGAHLLANNSRALFVYDVNSSTVLRSRTVANLSSVLAVSPDASQFVSGAMVFETSTMAVLAQQSAVNSPFVFPAGTNFNTQTTQGGAVYAQTLLGPALITGYNVVPTLVPAARSNTSELLFNTPDNLLVQLGLQVPETQSGRMVITADGSTLYAISQSGFLVFPLSTLTQPQIPCTANNIPTTCSIGIPDSAVALLAFDQCGLTAAQNSAVIPVRSLGGGRLTVTSQVLTTSATAATSRVTARPYGGDVTASFNAAATRTLGTATPDQLLIQAAEAVNIIPHVRIYQNNRNTETRGTILAVDVGATTTGLTDMAADNARQRLYIANPGLNRVEVFDMRTQKFLAPIGVGQQPRSIAIGGDGNTLYVANGGGESISVVDLNRGAVSGRVAYPPLWFNGNPGVLAPQIIASTSRGPQVLMSDGTLWKIVGNTVQPRVLNTNVFGAVRSIPAPQSMAASPDGSFLLLLAGNGSAYLYDATIDDFVTGRAVIPNPITGYYGPIAAGSNGQFYLTNDQLLNPALTSVGSSGGTGPVGGGGLPAPGGPSSTGRPVAAVAIAGPQSFARFSMPVRATATTAPTDAGLIEIVDAATQRTNASVPGLEGPLAVAAGTARVNISGRMMAIDPTGANAYVLTASGLSIIPLSQGSTQGAPALTGSAVVNTANYSASVAPGGLISIFGRNLGSTASAQTVPLPTVLGGACVTLNNAPLPLLAASPTQVNAQIPPTLAAGRYPLVVRSTEAQAASGSVTVTVSKYAPAIFIDAQGPAIFHKDGTRVNKAHPANRDEPLTIYATGLGTTTGGRVTSGAPSPSSPLAVTAPVTLFFGDPTIKQAAVIVDWSGLLPGSIGVYQINARVPGFHLKGDALPVTLRIGGVSTPTTGPSAALVYVN